MRKELIQKDVKGRICLLVVGMHRSGTSAVTGMLSRLGADSPKTLMPVTAENPRGYGESIALMDFHDRLLTSAGSNWYDFEPFNNEWSDSPVVESFAAELRDLVRTEFGELRLFVVKDPRISRFLPFWLRQLEVLNVMPRIVICLRNPLEVAASLNRRDDLSFTISLLLWLRHTLDAEATSRNLVRAVVRYEDVLTDWRGVANRLERDFSLHWPKCSGTVTSEINKFLSRSLRHHEVSEKQLLSRKDVVEWIKTVYPILADMGRHGTPASRFLRKMDDVKLQLDRVCLAFGPIFAERSETVAVARAATRELEAHVGNLSRLLAERKVKNAELEMSLAARTKEMEAKNAELEMSLAARTKEMEAKNAELEMSLAARTKEMEAKNAELEMSLRVRTKEMEAKNAELEMSLRVRTKEMEVKNAELEMSLRARTNEMEALKRSTSWVITVPLRRLGVASPALRHLGSVWKRCWWMLTLRFRGPLRRSGQAVALTENAQIRTSLGGAGRGEPTLESKQNALPLAECTSNALPGNFKILKTVPHFGLNDFNETPRTEDVKFSPSGRVLAVVATSGSIFLFAIETRSRSIHINQYAELHSTSLSSPHGIDFLSEDVIVVANRAAWVTFYRIPSVNAWQDRMVIEPIHEMGSVWFGSKGSTRLLGSRAVCCGPGAVRVHRKNLFVTCNKLSTVTVHPFQLQQGAIETGEGTVMAQAGLEIPDGVSLSYDGRLMAVSDHHHHRVVIYRCADNSQSCVLRDVDLHYPHGLCFDPTGRLLFVGDAGARNVHVFASKKWDKSINASTLKLSAVEPNAFRKTLECTAQQYRELEGGIKGIDIDPSGRIVATTCRHQTLRFFEMSVCVEKETSIGKVEV